MLISVIIPVYNIEEYVGECIDSVLQQDYKELEIILVDDGSTDGTSVICDEWTDKDSRVKVIHKENGGAASARNTGLDNATGEFIGFVDADDYIDLDMYEMLLNDIVNNNADAARCGIERVSDDGKVENWGTGNTDIVFIDKKQLLKDIGAAEGILPVSPCNKLYKSSCIASIRYDTRFKFAEDTLFNFMVAKNINTMVLHDINKYHYSFNSASITNKGITENNFDEHRVMDEIFKLSDEETLPHCIKGDVLKSFRTLRQISASGLYFDRFNEIRKRIIRNRKAVFHSGLYSKATKYKTLLLWLMPSVYKVVVRVYSGIKY